MAKNSPIFGSIRFSDVFSFHDLIERLEQVAAHFFHQTPISAYLTLRDGTRHYGLSKEELLHVYGEKEGEIRLVVFSLQAKAGGGVRVEANLGDVRTRAEARYFIASPYLGVNQDIREILKGTWEPREIDPEAQAQLGSLVQGVLQNKQASREKNWSDPIPEARIPEQITESFRVDPQVPASQLMEMLEEISVVYMEGAPFVFQLSTVDRDFWVDVPEKQVLSELRFNRRSVHTLYAESMLGGEEGESEGVGLTLRFQGVGEKPNVQVKIFAHRGEEIFHHIFTTLGSPEKQIARNVPFQRRFSFDRETFSPENLARAILTIKDEYFKGKTPVIDLFPADGEPWGRLSTGEWVEAYQSCYPDIRYVKVTLEDRKRGHHFFLDFHWEGEEAGEGMLKVDLDHPEKHQTIHQFLWERLGLTYGKKKAADPGEEGAMELFPVFKQREFASKGKACLIFMPLEAYWSDSVWGSLQAVLEPAGFTGFTRGLPLTDPASLEQNWAALHEAELILVDLTYRHPEVFYYLGLIHTVGATCIMLSQHDRDLPPAFQAFPAIVYDNSFEGLTRLAENLTDELGKLSLLEEKPEL